MKKICNITRVISTLLVFLISFYIFYIENDGWKTIPTIITIIYFVSSLLTMKISYEMANNTKEINGFFEKIFYFFSLMLIGTVVFGIIAAILYFVFAIGIGGLGGGILSIYGMIIAFSCILAIYIQAIIIIMILPKQTKDKKENK